MSSLNSLYGKEHYSLFEKDGMSFSLRDLDRFSPEMSIVSPEPAEEPSKKIGNKIVNDGFTIDLAAKAKFFREALFDPVVLRNDKAKLRESVKLFGCIGSRRNSSTTHHCSIGMTRSMVH